MYILHDPKGPVSDFGLDRIIFALYFTCPIRKLMLSPHHVKKDLEDVSSNKSIITTVS